MGARMIAVIRLIAVQIFVLFVATVCPSGIVLASQICAENDRKPLSTPVKLRVALYPFTPDRFRIFQVLEAEFECLYPGLNLELVEEQNAADRYYDSDDDKKWGFKFVNADVYEIDTILLSEFVNAGKIAPIALPFGDFEPDAIKAASRNGATYAVPHWLCGNFLFYRRDDTAIGGVKTWAELEKILTERGQGLFVDMKGGLTLGEWYLTALSDFVGVEAAQAAITSGRPLNADAMKLLASILRNCPVGYCRSEVLHDERVGFYARAFVRGQVSAYIGYSESLHYGLRELLENCAPGSGCLRENNIAVRRLPSARPDANAIGIGWVDGLAIDASLSGVKKDLALAFIKFATETKTYQKLLTPELPYSSRYLLAARPIGPVNGAMLYDDFYSARGRATVTTIGLIERLRKMAKTQVNCELPKERGDNSCRP